MRVDFKFEIGQRVKVKATGKIGTVISLTINRKKHHRVLVCKDDWRIAEGSYPPSDLEVVEERKTT